MIQTSYSQPKSGFRGFGVISTIEESKGPRSKMAEDFISRFRSKEDLYRYLTQEVK